MEWVITVAFLGVLGLGLAAAYRDGDRQERRYRADTQRREEEGQRRIDQYWRAREERRKQPPKVF